jgi:hypothetical protein
MKYTIEICIYNICSRCISMNASKRDRRISYTIGVTIALLLLVLPIIQMANAQPLPTTWRVNGNGYTGDLTLRADPAGKLTGTIYNDPINGFWDETSQKITFIRMHQGAHPSTAQVWTGYLFGNPRQSTLAGSFEAFSATAERSLFGWYACNPALRWCAESTR